MRQALAPAAIAELRAGAERWGTETFSHGQRDDVASPGGFWSQAYFDLLDHPTVAPLLDEMYCGSEHRAPLAPVVPGLPSFRLDHVYVQTYEAHHGGTIIALQFALRDMRKNISIFYFIFYFFF